MRAADSASRHHVPSRAEAEAFHAQVHDAADPLSPAVEDDSARLSYLLHNSSEEADAMIRALHAMDVEMDLDGKNHSRILPAHMTSQQHGCDSGSCESSSSGFTIRPTPAPDVRASFVSASDSVYHTAVDTDSESEDFIPARAPAKARSISSIRRHNISEASSLAPTEARAQSTPKRSSAARNLQECLTGPRANNADSPPETGGVLMSFFGSSFRVTPISSENHADTNASYITSSLSLLAGWNAQVMQLLWTGIEGVATLFRLPARYAIRNSRWKSAEIHICLAS